MSPYSGRWHVWSLLVYAMLSCGVCAILEFRNLISRAPVDEALLFEDREKTAKI